MARRKRVAQRELPELRPTLAVPPTPTDGSGQKAMADITDIADLSIQRRAEGKLQPEAWGTNFWVVTSASGEVADWWSQQRDNDLRDFWMKAGNDVLQGAVSSMVKKFKAMSWALEGPEAKDPDDPEPGTVEYHQQVLSEAEFGKGWGTLLGKVLTDYLCLYGQSRVMLGGNRTGQVKPIRAIVQEQDSGPVLSISSDGQIVEREVIGWEKTPLGSRRWWWISLESSGHARQLKGGLFLTEDHPVLTEQGWLLARDVTPGMKVATGDPEPSSEQMEFLVGTLMGDGCLHHTGNKTQLRLGHGLKQSDWLCLKMQAMSGFGWTPVQENKNKNGTVFLGANSHASAALNSLYEAFYKNGRKIVPKELIVQHFGPRLLATWFCDDGSIHHPKTKNGKPTREVLSLSTHGFTKSDTEWLSGFLTAKGFPCLVQKTIMHNDVYYYLRFNVDASERLLEYIGAYVPPCIRYKLSDESPRFDDTLWSLKSATVHYSTVLASKAREPKVPYGTCKTTYHISVKETGNFIAAGIVVHNTQDRGAFIELIGEGDPAGPIAKPGVRGLAHLDSGLCTLTGDTEFPVVFNNPKTGKPHKLHATRVIHLVDMPSPVESMNEVGFCAVSRCIASSQVLLKLAKYKNEKLSDLPQAGLLILNNILPAKFDDAKANYESERRRLGQELWANIMTLFGYDPSNPVSADFLSFANLPDGFNEQQAYELYVRIVALSFGVDIREFWPVSGGQLGTATESLVMHQKARGKGVGEVIASIERAINWKALPATVTFRFDFQDDEEDEQKARIADQKAVTLMRLWQPAAVEGEPQLVTRDEMRQMLAENVPYFKPDFLTLAASSETTVSDTERKALGFGRDVKLWSDGKKEYRRLRLGKREAERVLDTVLDNYQAGRVRVEDLARFALAELADVC